MILSDGQLCDCPGMVRSRSYGDIAQAPEAAGFVTANRMATGIPPARSVTLGVMTGVLVWMITRWLDGRK